MAFLYQLTRNTIASITKTLNRAKAIWDALKTRHMGEERVQQARLQTLKSEFEMLHMKEDETIDAFTTKLTTLVNKASSLGHSPPPPMKDGELVRKLLNAVPDRYLQIVASIEQYSDLEEMTLEEAIEDEEQNVSQEGIGYKETNKESLWYLDNGASNHMTGVREHFKELDEKNEYISEHTNNEPKWTDFKIGDIEVTNEYHDQETEPTEDNDEFSNNNDDYASPQRDSPLQHQTLSTHHQEHSPELKVPKSHAAGHGFSTRILQLSLNYSPLGLTNTEELLLAEDEPKNYKEASSDQKWIEAMKTELDSINRNNTWELTTLPTGHKAIGLKWIFKTKKDANGDIIKHKARLVAKGYILIMYTNLKRVFAPVARMETIRLLLAIAATNKWEVHHLDVKSAFLHGDLKEEVFQKCALEQAIYTKTSKDLTLLIGVYVDDLIITGAPKKEIDKFKAQMKEKFEMSDLGLLAYYLGIEVTQANGDISIKQSAYASKILKEAGMIDCNETLIPMDPGTRLTKITEGTMVDSTEYRSIIGCLRYLLHTRPDLSYSVGLLSRFMQEPKEQHMKAIRQVLRYVKGTKDYGITYKHNGGNKIHGFSDSSYGVNTQEGKGTTGIIFYYGESPINWMYAKNQQIRLSLSNQNSSQQQQQRRKHYG
ncbi:ribonuclease H-like domain, reverse transcriptase, RNA-dependent DNA polymerase [Tanacetum coccineum]